MKVGVILPLGERDDLGREFTYAELRDLALRAEAGGLDSVWIYDHLIYRFPGKPQSGVWEGWTILSALAEATERVELGTLVLCTAFRNPAVLAKMAVTLDEVTGGRLILGLGAGWHEPEFTAFGFPYDHLVDRFEEALKVIVPLVREGRVDFTGRYVAAPTCEMDPPPARNIPVLIASFKPRMLKLTAEYADGWNTAWLGHVDALGNRRAAIEAACAETGRDPSTLEVTVGLNVAFPALGDVPETASDPAKFIAGSVDEVATGLRNYADAGVGHVIANVSPLSAESLDNLAQAAKLARGSLIPS
jgi:alkanesulfonate monooxygenase SsuD/methylene tetrahydromethanopterin reductase-like flavin-dependent oxidoreductase (luciferase family)